MTAQPARKGEGQTTAQKRLKLAYECEDGTTGIVAGRFAWTLLQLATAGEKGVTPIERPAPRWSHYVYKLRHDHGFDIETIDERHAGDFPGTHGRYVLHDKVKLRNPDKTKPAGKGPGGLQDPKSRLAGEGSSDE